MTPIRASLLVSLISIGCLAAVDAQARSGGSQGGGYRGGSPGAYHGSQSGSWRGGSSYGHYRGGHYRYGNYWPWGIGIALAAPWYWGTYYYPYNYGPRYYPAWNEGTPYGPYANAPEGYGYSTPPEPSTEIGPVSEPGAPVERPLYLNYCASSKSYYPKVKSCAEGWQMKRPSYQ